MSHQFLVPINENGILLDKNIQRDLAIALGSPFQFQDVFLFSHGWWTDANQAMQEYNRVTIEFAGYVRESRGAAVRDALNVGVHWPSMLSENELSLENYAEALSFYTMELRADAIGKNAVYVLLQFILAGRNSGSLPLRVHLIGHSFGCKVVCRALERLADEGNTQPPGVAFDVVLLQAAFDNDKLEKDQDYGNLLTQFPGLRMLVTRSHLDEALGKLYPLAHRLAHLFGTPDPALGYTGPSDATVTQVGGSLAINVGPDFQAKATSMKDRLIVADLTELHAAHPENAVALSGHHSDIFHPEIYSLLAAFFFES